MMVRPERLKSRIDAINASSLDPNGGYTRLAFTEQDRTARKMIVEMMEDAGLAVEQDAAGNILGSYHGGCAPFDYIAAGSHLDTVRNGGPLDGLLGTAAAIEALQCIAESNVPLKHPLRAIVFADEEGARFGSGMIGSMSIAGKPLEAPVDSYFDQDGISLSSALRSFGIDPERILQAAAPSGLYRAFVELHIEQSIVLEQHQKQVGIVSGIKGPYWIKGSFLGEANHAGGTPMNMRRDALAAASMFAADTYRIARDLGDEFVATIGAMEVWPGGINTIPGQVDYTVDIRDLDMEHRQEGIFRILQAAERAAENCRVEHRSTCIKNERSIAMSPAIMGIIERICADWAIPHMELPSGAFHDTLSMASICDSGMIFVPSIGGISHSPKERTAWNDIYRGSEVLCHTLLCLAQGNLMSGQKGPEQPMISG